MNNNTENNTNNKPFEQLQFLSEAGKKYTKTSQEMYSAAYEVAQEIIEAAPTGVELPRGYKVVYKSSNLGGEYFLTKDATIVDATKGYYLHGDYNKWIDKAPKSLILQFARDVRQGLLSEIADFLEQMAGEQEQIVTELNEAKK